MGLPLWQPRVESDIPSRPEAKNPAHARSRIRSTSTRDRGTAIRERPTARNGELRSRERRRGLLQDMQERLIGSNSSSSSNNNNNNNPQIPEPPAREPVRRLPAPAEEVEYAQGELWAEIYRNRPEVTVDWHPPPAEGYGDEEPLRHFGDSRDNLREQLAALRRLERETGGSLGGAHNTDRFARANDRIERARAALERTRLSRLNRRSNAAVDERAQRLRAQATIFARAVRNDTTGGNGASRPEAAARVDGLGDRNRSLSPENDNAWDTLLTTVTPDPQPPSAGSSFASILSAVASRSSINESSGTSLTGPDTGAEESALEQPCDSDDEGDPVEFEVELGDETNASARSSGAPGSYADVVRLGEYSMPGGVRTRNPPVYARRIPPRAPPYTYDGTGSGINAVNAAEPGAFRTPIDRTDPAPDDLILQLVGGLGGMQHIVRNLVRREDIPNDWWVDAGLSRTLPRDGSADSGSGNANSGNNDSSND